MATWRRGALCGALLIASACVDGVSDDELLLDEEAPDDDTSLGDDVDPYITFSGCPVADGTSPHTNTVNGAHRVVSNVIAAGGNELSHPTSLAGFMVAGTKISAGVYAVLDSAAQFGKAVIFWDYNRSWSTISCAGTPRLEFVVKIGSSSEAGLYRVMLRTRTKHGEGDDSLYVTVDGKLSGSSFARFDLPNNTTGYRWSSSPMGTANTVYLPTGFHTISIWAREDGFYLDRVVLCRASATSASCPTAGSLTAGPSSTYTAIVTPPPPPPPPPTCDGKLCIDDSFDEP